METRRADARRWKGDTPTWNNVHVCRSVVRPVANVSRKWIFLPNKCQTKRVVDKFIRKWISSYCQNMSKQNVRRVKWTWVGQNAAVPLSIVFDRVDWPSFDRPEVFVNDVCSFV